MSDVKVPSKKLLEMKMNKKIQKYKWVAEHIARMVHNRLPKNSDVKYQDLEAVAFAELGMQIKRLYTEQQHINRLWDEKKKDLTVGPFFLKGLKTADIKPSDPGSIKFIKGKVWDELRQNDPATPTERKKISEIEKFKRKFRNATNYNPDMETIEKKTGIPQDEVNRLMEVNSTKKVKMNPNTGKTQDEFDELDSYWDDF